MPAFQFAVALRIKGGSTHVSHTHQSNPAFRIKLSLAFLPEEPPNVQEAQVPVNRVVYGPA
jgi:hypothetical protein